MNATFQFGLSFRLEDIFPSCMYIYVPILGYVFPLFAVLVTSVNILAAVVFMQPRVRSHTTYILTLIACTDTLNILFPTITFVYNYTFGHYKDYVSYRFCFWLYILADVCVDFFNAFSLWLTVILAYIRCKCIKSPFNAHNIHTLKRVAAYVMCVLILTVISHLPNLFLFDFIPTYRIDQSTNTTEEVCIIIESDFVFSNSSIERKVQICVATLLDSVVPCLILLYLNFVILLTLREAKLSRSSMRRGEPEEAHSLQVTKRTRETREKIKPDQNCSRTLMKCEDFGNVAADSSNEPSIEKDETDAFYDTNVTRPKSILPKNKFLSYCFCSKMDCFSVKHKSLKRMTKVSTNSAFDKLDRESRRTSWLILAVATIISLHEIPLAVVNVYTLVKHAGVSLPLNVYGCHNVILFLWQYVSYMIIFLIYAFMSGAFRTELKRVLTLICKHDNVTSEGPRKVFMSPCSVRRTITIEEGSTAGPSHASDY